METSTPFSCKRAKTSWHSSEATTSSPPYNENKRMSTGTKAKNCYCNTYIIYTVVCRETSFTCKNKNDGARVIARSKFPYYLMQHSFCISRFLAYLFECSFVRSFYLLHYFFCCFYWSFLY